MFNTQLSLYQRIKYQHKFKIRRRVALIINIDNKLRFNRRRADAFYTNIIFLYIIYILLKKKIVLINLLIVSLLTGRCAQLLINRIEPMTSIFVSCRVSCTAKISDEINGFFFSKLKNVVRYTRFYFFVRISIYKKIKIYYIQCNKSKCKNFRSVFLMKSNFKKKQTFFKIIGRECYSISQILIIIERVYYSHILRTKCNLNYHLIYLCYGHNFKIF